MSRENFFDYAILSTLLTPCTRPSPTYVTSFRSFTDVTKRRPRGLIMGKGNYPNSQYGWDWGIWVPGAFKLDDLLPFKPILFWKFSNFFTFILGSQFFRRFWDIALTSSSLSTESSHFPISRTELIRWRKSNLGNRKLLQAWFSKLVSTSECPNGPIWMLQIQEPLP